MKAAEEITIINTTEKDLDKVFDLFEQAMTLQGKNGYKVWNNIDKDCLKKDIENKLQFKIQGEGEILCLFSVQYNDPFIWRERDKNDAIYLHRIVVNPNFKGQRQFEKILTWASQLALQKNRSYLRMDTWADNPKIIEYYKSFGFRLIETYRTTDAAELPVQNRNLNVVLLELDLKRDQ